MPKKDLQDPWSFLTDLFRELPILYQIALFLGMVAGTALWLYLFGPVVVDRIRPHPLVLIGTFVGLLIAGGFLGCVGAVLIELTWKALRGTPPDSKSRKRRQ